MASIVYQIDKKTGAKYAFSSESYWDKEKQQPRSRRKYLGKVDPETGEIIPKKEKEHSDEQSPEEISVLNDKLKAAETRIIELEAELTDMTSKYESAVDALSRISEIASSIE